MNVLTTSLFARFRSRQHPAFADKVLSAMRKGFGDHKEVPTEEIRAGVQCLAAVLDHGAWQCATESQEDTP